MRTALIIAFFLAAHLPTPLCAGAEITGNDSPVVATVLGKKITASDIGLQYDKDKPVLSAGGSATCLADDPIGKLHACMLKEVARDYTAKNNLQATDGEIREFQEYQDRSMTQAHLEWQKRLSEVDKKLQSADLGADERKQTEEERATLVRLTTPDRQLEGDGQKVTAEELRDILGPWIEKWKFSKSIYDKYGGAVAITKFGPHPIGAVKGLMDEYEKQGALVIHDESLRSAFWTHLSEPPRLVAKPEEIDFTPYWKKPLPQDDNRGRTP